MKYYKTQSGFSLVETLVAVTLLLIVIVGPMSIVTSSSRSTSFSSEQAVAFLLAQEGVELAQKARDDYMLQLFKNPPLDTAWDDFMTEYDDCFTGPCGLSVTDAADGAVAVIDCGNCQLQYQTDDSITTRARYSYAGGEPSPYTRVVRMNEINPGEIEVRSIVTWRTGNFRSEQSAEVTTYLYELYE